MALKSKLLAILFICVVKLGINMEVYVDLEAVSIFVILLWPYFSALRVVPCVSLVFSMSKLTALISRVFAALDA